MHVNKPDADALGLLVAKAAIDEGHQAEVFLAGDAVQLVRERSLWRAVAVSNAYSPARDPVLLAAVAAGSRALQGAFATAQEAGELTRAFSATALATLFEGMLLRLCIGYCAGPPPERPLESAVAEALAFFMRAARV